MVLRIDGCFLKVSAKASCNIVGGGAHDAPQAFPLFEKSGAKTLNKYNIWFVRSRKGQKTLPKPVGGRRDAAAFTTPRNRGLSANK